MPEDEMVAVSIAASAAPQLPFQRHQLLRLAKPSL
jgi:hypothetical protein